MITFNYLMAQALIVLNAKLKKENTAKRIGGLFRDILLFIQNLVLGIILKGDKANEAAIKAIINPTKGDTYKASDTGHYWCYDGTQWNDVGKIIPTNAANKEDVDLKADIKNAEGIVVRTVDGKLPTVKFPITQTVTYETDTIPSNVAIRTSLEQYPTLSSLGMIETFEIILKKGGYSNKQGLIITDGASAANFSYTDFYSTIGAEFSLSSVYVSANVAAVCLFDGYKNFLQEYVPEPNVFFSPQLINGASCFIRMCFNTLNYPFAIGLIQRGSENAQISLSRVENGINLTINEDKLLISNGKLVDFLELSTLKLTHNDGSYWNASNGLLSYLGIWISTSKYRVYNIKKLYIKGFTNATYGYILLWDKNGTYLSYVKPGISSPEIVYEYTIAENIGFVAFNLGRNTDGYSFAEMILLFSVSVNGDFDSLPLLPYWRIPKENIVGLEDNGSPIIIPKSWITLGDSITWQDGKKYGQGSAEGTIARGYQTQVNEIYNKKFIVNNKGVSGQPMTGASSSTYSIGIGLDYTSVDLLTIAAGTNDFKLNKPLGEIGSIFDTDNTLNVETFFGAYRKLLNYIFSNNPRTRIVLFTPIHRNNSGYTIESTNTAGHKLIDYVNAIKAIAEMYGLPVVDLYSNSGINTKNLSILTMDGLHPNDDGYTYMAIMIAKYLDRFFIK